ncbi:hypothetical protein BDQ12DRAFT_674721 [Crucibulum laeve]|uniref:Pentatricopeptide repeat protein n=1 Tax=Crucibulum laeve TaxID=68775 RepID=A0A5C3MF46_9AGAR|nr:hypothetical protein BDQ12DRAFT_674721 [Crucibulum laeve]
MLRASTLGLSLRLSTFRVPNAWHITRGTGPRQALARSALNTSRLHVTSPVPFSNGDGQGRDEQSITILPEGTTFGTTSVSSSQDGEEDANASLKTSRSLIHQRNNSTLLSKDHPPHIVHLLPPQEANTMDIFDDISPRKSSPSLNPSVGEAEGREESAPRGPTPWVRPINLTKNDWRVLNDALRLYGFRLPRRQEKFQSVIEIDDIPEQQDAVSKARAVEELDPATLRLRLLYDISRTQSATQAWEAYVHLMGLRAEGRVGEQYIPFIPFAHLHRICRLLSKSKPKTRLQFHQLLTVLTTLWQWGGNIHLYEWNSLIDHAGKGLRKTRIEDLRQSLNVYNGMLIGRLPEAGEISEREVDEAYEVPMEPDIYTYTTLISTAARTLDSQSVSSANALLQESGLPPNRITYLSLLRYFTLKKSLSGVRAILMTMRKEGFDLGIDGINACIWAYGKNDRTNIIKMIYRVLRHNVVPETSTEDDVHSLTRQLEKEECIFGMEDLIPNEITYTTVIQTMAHQGEFIAAVGAFTDMLSTVDKEKPASPTFEDDADLAPEAYAPTAAIYRAIFLGFCRHATPPINKKRRTLLQLVEEQSHPTWTLDNLLSFFQTFLTWPANLRPSKRLIFWIMVAFDKASGRNIELLREVWKQMEDRFDGPWGGKNHRLQRMRKALFPEEDDYRPPRSKPG